MSVNIENSRYLISVQLEGIRPPLWREVIVPADISLAWLHEVIQAVMFWDDMHLHQFEQKRRYYGRRSSEDVVEMHDECKVALCDLVKKPKDWIRYEYDFGDGWEHRVELKKILDPDAEDVLRCVKSKGGDVIEDCGGAHGYMELMKLKQAVESGAKGVDRDAYDHYELAEHDFGNCDLEYEKVNLEDVRDDALEGGGLHPGAEPPAPNPMFGGGGGLLDSDEDFSLEADDEGFLDFMQSRTDALLDAGEADEDLGEEDFPEPYSELKADALAEFGQTLALAGKVRAAEPWKKLWNRDVFAVEDPETEELDIVSVLGAGKEVYSIHVHRAPTAMAFWKLAFSPAGLDPESVLMLSTMVEAEFVNKGAMELTDLDLYKYAEHVTPPRGRHRWVRFRSYRPRSFPWFSEAADLASLRRGMQLTLRYLELMQQSDDPAGFLTSDLAPGTMPGSLKVFRLAEGADSETSESWQLQDVPVNWEQCGGQVPVYQPTDFECMRLAKMPKQDDIWEVGTTCLTNGVMTATGPVMPVLAMACSISNGNVPPKPEFTADAAISEAQTLWECLVANIDAQGYCPSEIRVVTDEAFEMLAPFAELAGVQLAQFKEYKMLGQLFEMLAMMPEPGDL
jgi:hypothetical protein